MTPVAAQGGLFVSVVDGAGFAGALFLRDRLSPLAFAQIPPLTGGPVRESNTLIPDSDWDEWWRELADAPPGRVASPPARTVLSAMYEERLDEIHQWVNTHTASAEIAAYRPQWLPPLLARQAGHGRHDTEVLPVDGIWWLSLSPRRLLVSRAAYADHELLDQLWRPRIAALLTE